MQDLFGGDNNHTPVKITALIAAGLLESNHKKAEIELPLFFFLNGENSILVLRMPSIFLLYLRSFANLLSGRYMAKEK